MQGSWQRNADTAGIAAAACFLAALVGFGMALDGYSQARHPVALLGASGVPRALAFNLLGFVLPGLLAMVVALRLRRGLAHDAGWAARIGTRLVLLSALAFAAQGLLPLDPGDLDHRASRWHATAWMLWWIAFVPGALLGALGPFRMPGLRRFAWLSLVAATLVVFFAVLAPVVPAGVAQRTAFMAWFGWLALAPVLRK